LFDDTSFIKKVCLHNPPSMDEEEEKMVERREGWGKIM